jgi:hypothetical protein
MTLDAYGKSEGGIQGTEGFVKQVNAMAFRAVTFMVSPSNGVGRKFHRTATGGSLASRLCDSVVVQFEPTGVAPRVGVWETISMTTKPPKIGDSVTIRGSPVEYVVTGVNAEKKTADVKATRDVIVLHKDVPLAKIFRLDESQNALRIVREVTDER